MMINITQGIVGPSFGDVEIFDEDTGVSSPHLSFGYQAAWWNNGSGEKLSFVFDDSSFKDYTFVTDHNIVSNGARIESAVRTYGRVPTNFELGLHTRGK
jgi:hypothetical protein